MLFIPVIFYSGTPCL